jgi:hypothetical protein
MDNGAVAYRHIVTYFDRMVISRVDYHTVLNIGALSDPDRAFVSAHYRIKPDTALLTY